MNKRINIIIIDDNIQFRKNLINYLTYKLNYNVIAEASNGLEFLDIIKWHYADIILMDIAMEVMDGFEATKKALWNINNLNIIAITMYIEKVFLLKLIEAGFKGCVFKNNIYKDLETAIENVMHGKLFFPEGIKFK